MMTDSEIINLWGEENLIRHKNTDMVQGIDYETNYYLSNVGLPKEDVLLLNFDIELHSLAKLKGFSGFDKYIVIGVEDGRDYICLNNDLSVVLIDKQVKDEKFINSSLKKFIQCLAEYKKVQNERSYRYEHGMELESESTARELEKTLATIDNEIESSEYFWSVITEQIEFEQI